MKKHIWLILVLGLALLALGLGGCESITAPPSRATTAGGIYSSQNSGIWVSGEGKVTAVPDVALLSLGVQAQAATVDQAQGQASNAMNAVVGALKTGGVADKDIKTTNFSIQQLTRYDDKTQQQIVTGYLVTNTVTVKVRVVANTGAIIDAVAKAGGDNARVNSIGFTIDNPATYESQARQLAMADAKAKAKQLADLAGVKLGAPTYISESGGYVPLPAVRNAAPAAPSAATTPVSPGETDITVDVQVTYGID